MIESRPNADSPNPRVQRTRARVLSIARELLPKVGPMGLTYSLLAEEAHVTRQTLYRHWPTREGLLVDLVLSGAVTEYPESRQGLGIVARAFLNTFREAMQDPGTGSALISLAAQGDGDHESARALELITESRRQVFNGLLEPSVRPVTADEFARLIGPVLFKRFIARQPVTDAFLDSVVEGWLPLMQPPATPG
ncbi:TetR/AcrR family transcriptional regulator [Streptomyces sp. NPDC047023]|uniref:TetR/AcrR family transcriptional regulator n=1 Tax=Streptomyces sp. NPDC047023 TaxID=3155139 RepID=UPI0034117E21